MAFSVGDPETSITPSLEIYTHGEYVMYDTKRKGRLQHGYPKHINSVILFFLKLQIVAKLMRLQESSLKC